MNRTLVVLLVLALVVAAGIGIFVSFALAPSAVETGALGTDAAGAGPAATDRDADAADPRRAKTEARRTPADDARAVAGKVASDTGAPIEGAVVECRSVPEGEPEDGMRIARDLLGDTIPKGRLEAFAKRMQDATRRVGDDAGAVLNDPDAMQDAVGFGLEMGAKLMSDPGAIRKVRRVIEMTAAGVESDADLRLVATARTDARGTFRIDGLEPGRVELRVTAPRHQRRKTRVAVGTLTADVSLAKAGAVAGRVVSGGEAVAGAEVRTRTVTLRTDGSGRFVHDGARAPREPLWVSAEGHVAAATWADVALEGAPTEVVIELEPAGTVRGRVTDASGSPVAGAAVSPAANAGNLMMMMNPAMQRGVRLESDPSVATTKSDGTYVLSGVRAGSVKLRAEASGFLAKTTDSVAVAQRANVDGVDFVLLRESALEGRVTDPAGAPIADATVKVSMPAEGPMKMAAQFMGGTWATGTTDADGRYRVGGVAEGDHDVEAEAVGFRTWKTKVKLPPEAAAKQDVTLLPGFQVGGVVLLPDGTPAAGATVRVREPGAAGANPFAAMMDMGGGKLFPTESDGRFTATGLEQGPYEVTAIERSSIDATVADVQPDTMDLVLRLGAAARITGKVVAAADGAPIAGATVSRKGKSSRGGGGAPWMDMMRRDPTVTTDAGGTFRIDGLAAGSWELSARARGFADSAKLKVNAVAGETTADLVLALPPGAALSGRVVRKGDGTPVEGALVFVAIDRSPMGGIVMSDIVGGEPTAPANSVSAKTGADGTFVLEGLTPGKVPLEVRAQSFAALSLGGVDVPGGGVVAEVSEGGAVEGVVYGKDGGPMEGASVLLQRGMMGQGGRMATSGRDGSYRIENVVPGTMSILLLDPESPMGFGGMASVSVRDGETTRHDFGKPGSGRTVAGLVLRDGKPFEGASIVLMGGQAGMKLAETDAAGRFRLANVPPGEYTVMVQSQTFGGGGTSVKVAVAADADPAEVRLEVSSLAVTGTVVDAESGKPIGVAQVLLLAAGSGRGGSSFADFAARQKGQTFTGGDGSFRIADMPAGTYSLRVTAANYVETTVDGVVAGGEPVRVAMSRGLEFVVTVLGPDGKPVQNASVVPVDARGEEGFAFDISMQKITGADGTARLRLQGGRYTLRVRAAGHPEAEATVDASAGQATVRFEAGGALEVAAKGAGGAPVAGATVKILDAAGAEIVAAMNVTDLFGGGTTDQEGRTRREGLRAGGITVVVKSPAGPESRAAATIVAGETARVEVTFE